MVAMTKALFQTSIERTSGSTKPGSITSGQHSTQPNPRTQHPAFTHPLLSHHARLRLACRRRRVHRPPKLYDRDAEVHWQVTPGSSATTELPVKRGRVKHAKWNSRKQERCSGKRRGQKIAKCTRVCRLYTQYFVVLILNDLRRDFYIHVVTVP